jgi:hypothetical protein
VGLIVKVALAGVFGLILVCPASAVTVLDAPGRNGCYLFFKFTQNASTMNAGEVHQALRKIYYGGGLSGSAARASGDRVLRTQARRMLELEVSEGLTARWLTAARRFGDECRRRAR